MTLNKLIGNIDNIRTFQIIICDTFKLNIFICFDGFHGIQDNLFLFGRFIGNFVIKYNVKDKTKKINFFSRNIYLLY